MHLHFDRKAIKNTSYDVKKLKARSIPERGHCGNVLVEPSEIFEAFAVLLSKRRTTLVLIFLLKFFSKPLIIRNSNVSLKRLKGQMNRNFDFLFFCPCAY